jgi:hypothetical protein
MRSRRTVQGLVFVAAHRPRLGASIGARRSICDMGVGFGRGFLSP